MSRLVRQLFPFAVALLLSEPVFAQRSKDPAPARPSPCGDPNGGGANSTNYYGGASNPCAFTYSVPAERMNQLLNEAPYCAMYSRAQVNCARELTRDYGQIRLDPRGQAPPTPAASVSPAQSAEAERLWQRSVTLIDRNNYRDAIPLLLQAGRLGHAKAQSTLGIAYQDGNGVRRDDVAAAHWFGLAAAQGHRAAQYALAAMYEEGEGGLKKDHAKARELYLLSANQGFDKAQLEVGLAYEVGDGVPRSRARAIQMLRASGLGNSIASVLSASDTPARFANLQALGAYLKKLADIENAKLAARSPASRPQGGNAIDRINAAREYTNWTRRNEPGYCAYPPCK